MGLQEIREHGSQGIRIERKGASRDLLQFSCSLTGEVDEKRLTNLAPTVTNHPQKCKFHFQDIGGTVIITTLGVCNNNLMSQFNMLR